MTELPPVRDSRGHFFAVDRRAWNLVCALGMNAAVAYLVAARGTGGDNRTTKWSTNAVETRTGISRSRAKEAFHVLEKAGALHRDPASKPNYPKYKLVPAHEIKGCKGSTGILLDEEHTRVHVALGDGWVEVPPSPRNADLEYWGHYAPRSIARNLVSYGYAEERGKGGHFRATHYDAEAVAKPDWIWLPNTLVDGAANEVPPVELVRQTGNAFTLRLFMNLYGSQALDEDGGIHFRQLREDYTRHKVGERGTLVVWGFVLENKTAWSSNPFVAPHFSAVDDEAKRVAAWKEFWNCLRQLRDLGLIEFVGHLVHADTSEGEIIHPVALPGTGLEIERKLGRAAWSAALVLITEGQRAWATKQGVVMLAPVQRHIEEVQMVGIARLRYRPRTNRTLAFMAREDEWQAELERLREIAGGFATSR